MFVLAGMKGTTEDVEVNCYTCNAIPISCTCTPCIKVLVSMYMYQSLYKWIFYLEGKHHTYIHVYIYIWDSFHENGPSFISIK